MRGGLLFVRRGALFVFIIDRQNRGPLPDTDNTTVPRSARACHALLGLLMLVCGAGLADTAIAQSSAPGATVQAVRLNADEPALALTGRLDHPAWRRAPVHDGFVEKDPDNGAPPSQATRVQVVFDDRALYVGVTALDRDMARLRAPLVRPDGVNRTQDFVVVYVDPIGTRSGAQFFRVNAAGSLADGLHTAADDNEDFAPDFDWDAAVDRRTDGWTTVLRIPFSSLRFAGGREGLAPHDWRFMVGRRLPREQFHLFMSTPIPRGASSFIATMQPLAGVALPPNPRFLDVRPSITLRQARDADGRRSSGVDSSLDVKWRPRAELVIDGTVNPDFSQVALDVPQLAGNQRFALFVAEKRPFFFESADLLRMPTEALYTRSVTEPRAGLRATWRGPRWAGTSMLLSDRGGGLVLLPGAYGTDAVLQPANDVFAARARSDGGTLQWGGLVASRRYAGERGDNTVLGPDLNAALPGDWRLRAQWLRSRSTAVARQGQLARAALGQAQGGDLISLRLVRDTGLSETVFAVQDIGEQFRNDSGFINQAGIRKLEVFVSKGWENLGPFNRFFVNTDVSRITDRSGRLVSEVVRPGLWYQGQSNLEGWFEVFARSALRTGPEAPLLRERFVSIGMTVTPAPWWPLLEAWSDIGELADASANRVRPGGQAHLSAKLRPLPALEVEPRIDVAWLRAGGRNAYEETAVQLLAVWHLDARQNLRWIQQQSRLRRAAEPGVDGQQDAGRTSSLTYAWRVGLGTQLYVGATRSVQGFGPGGRSTEAFVKLQLDAGRWL
jgi:hypothetical protein